MNVGPEAVNRLVADALRARAKLGLIEPGLLSVSDRLLSRTIEDIRIYAPFTVVACHGDLHEGQILFDQDGDCRLIDPDAISRAPLEWDVANLSAHLVLESRLARLGRVGALEKALLGGFLEGLSATLASDFSLRRFAALKRLAVARLICVHGCRPGMLERVPGLVAWLRDQIRVEDRVRSIGRAGRSIDSNREARCGR